MSDLRDRLYDRLDDAADAEGVTKARRVGRGGVGEGGGWLRIGLTAVCVCGGVLIIICSVSIYMVEDP